MTGYTQMMPGIPVPSPYCVLGSEGICHYYEKTNYEKSPEQGNQIGNGFFCDITTLVRTPCCKILESISDGVFTIDADKRIISFNSAAEAITGFKAEDAVGQYCLRQGRRNLTPYNLAPSGMVRLSRAR
jgi:hypothetical protein